MFFTATDIANFVACRHLLTLKLDAAEGKIQKPYFHDLGVELLRELGERHETAYFAELASKPGCRVVSIPTDVDWTDSVGRTKEAIRDGADVIYQATFQDGHWGGRADFLVRVDKPSSLGSFSYEVVETKLAKSAKVRAILQLCFYSELLGNIQGLQPESMHVVLGGSLDRETFQVSRYIAYFRKVKRDFEQASAGPRDTYPEPVALCDVCEWYSVCNDRWHNDDHLSLVASITRIQRKELVTRDIRTMTALGNVTLPLVPKPERIGDTALKRICDQSRLQVKGRTQNGLIYELLPLEEGCGLSALPVPGPGDLFLDFESADYAFETGIEYLIGMVFLPDRDNIEPEYYPLWSFDPVAEKQAFERFIAIVMDRWKHYPGLHIYHYAPYEPAAIKRLAAGHGTCIDEVDQLLRAKIFVDLYRVVRQSLRASVESYSIKRLEGFYGFTRAVSARDSVVALQTFQSVLALGGDKENAKEIVDKIEAYNRDDCVSTLRLRDWLENRRHELEATTGAALPRPEQTTGEPSENLAEELNQARSIAAKLVQGLSPDPTKLTDQEYARWLLAQMMEWHRREEKSSWWEYFRLLDLSDQELLEDKSALGGLTYVGVVGQEKRSLIHRYKFPPQDHALDRAHDVRDPRTEKDPGEIVAIDEVNLTIDLKRGAKSAVGHPEALIPFDIIGSDAQRDSLLRLGSWVTENGIDGDGPYRAARNLLLRRPPSFLAGSLESVTDDQGHLVPVAKEMMSRLANEPAVLPVQGPPGSGKTFTGARMIVKLISQSYRVGVAAVSHKVISNLLSEVCKVARQNNVPVQAVQKPDTTDGCVDPLVKLVDNNQAVRDALDTGATNVVAGTTWLWARTEMTNSVDVLFIDEAGQMSLADVLAASQAAGSLVLLGDPQQLDQPQQGIHPPGADGSAFDHILRGHATIGPGQGLFLAETHRLHPDICEFTSEVFYEGRLKPRPENQRQRIDTDGPLNGTGLRLVQVVHTGNQSESKEEVTRISALISDLLGKDTTWTNQKGETQDLGLTDILVVAPYNAQVAALRKQLPPGARVGTVDKFQGQEAPIVFYSMTTSSPEDAPRGMEFLYSLNRLNVATSRARCVAVVVASPALFQVECKSPRQIELANAFCRYLELVQREVAAFC
jgi:predicted RecB family nuclease